MGRLAGKIAIVMRATRPGNMGQAIAQRFISKGATVVVSGRSADGLNATAAQSGATVYRPMFPTATRSSRCSGRRRKSLAGWTSR